MNKNLSPDNEPQAKRGRGGVNSCSGKVVHRISISRTTHGLDAVFLVLLTLLWLVILAVSSVQARVLDFTVAVNQAKPCFTVQPNNATTLHWMGDEGSRSTESADVLTVASGSSQDDPPDDKPHKPFGIRPCFDTLVESVSWQPMYAEKMVVGYRLWLSLQEDSLSIKGFSWWPVVAGVVLGKFIYTWWHSETSSFHQWEEQQYHASDQKIITCMDHPPGQSGYPQGGGGPGVSNQGTGGYHYRGNSFSMYGGYSPSGGGGGGHDPQDGHTRNYRPCPACCQQPCQYPVESSSHYYGQSDSSINDALPLSCYPPEPGVSTKYESTAVSLQASVQPPVPGWPSDHEPDDPGCICRRCLDLLIQCAATCEGQGGNCVERATSVENTNVSERPTAVIFPWPGTTSESYVHQQPGLVEESKPPSRKSSQSSQKKPPGEKWACSYPGCTKSYSSAYRLREHKASHLGEWACSYPGCTRSYSSAQAVKEHEASHEGKWACPHPGCTKSYSNARGLREHKASHWGKWACSYPGCTRSYSNAQALREHKASHEGKWACSHPGCTKSYSSARGLREHKASHKGK